MPIPIRSQSPIKATPTSSSTALTSTRGRSSTQDEVRKTKEPPRLLGGPAPFRSANNVAASSAEESTLGDLGLTATSGYSVSHKGARRIVAPSRSRSSPSDSGNASTASAFAEKRPSVAPLRAQPPLKNVARLRIPESKSQGRVATNPTKTPQGDDRNAGDDSGSVPVTGRKATILPARPGFDTYRQHFSPKKPTLIPGALTLPSGKVSSRPDTAGRIIIPTSEPGNFRDELLQLRLIHESSAGNLHAFETSVKVGLRSEFEDVEKRLSVLQSLCCDRQAKSNSAAMGQWLEHQRLGSVGSDTLLVLAYCTAELQEISIQDGRLDDVLKIFDAWCVYAFFRRSKRLAGKLLDWGNDMQASGDSIRVGPVGAPQWSVSALSVEERIRSCAALLRDLHRSGKASPIAAMVQMHMILAESMLRQIEICKTVESLIVGEEDGWLQEAVQDALQDSHLRHSAMEGSAIPRKGVWDLPTSA